MRSTLVLLFMASLALAACGHDEARETTTVVSPPPQVQQGSTVVVPPGTVTKVCPQGYTTC